jgi:hypothetical protein
VIPLPLVLLAAAGAAAWLLLRRAPGQGPGGPVAPPAVEPPTLDSSSLDEFGEHAAQQAQQSAKLLSAGLSGNPITAFFQVMLAALRDLKEGDFYLEWEWEKWAMPWVTSGAVWDDDGGVHIPVPDESAGGAATVHIPRGYLLAMLGDGNAVSACTSGGMFCWAPGLDTPVQRIIHELAPWVAEYEAEHLWPVWGALDSQGNMVDWSGFDDRRHWYDLTDNPYETKGTQAWEYDPRWFMVEDVKYSTLEDNPEDVGRWLRIVRRALQTYVTFGHETVSAWTRDLSTPEWNYRGVNASNQAMFMTRPQWLRRILFQRITRYQLVRPDAGLPGAWHWTDEETSNRGPTALYRRDSVLRHGGKLTVRDNPIDDPLGREAPLVVTDHSDLGRSEPQPPAEGDRHFVQWLPRGRMEEPRRVVVALSEFGSVSASERDLRAGILAWGPYTSEQHLETWRRIIPQLGPIWEWANLTRRWSHAAPE